MATWDITTPRALDQINQVGANIREFKTALEDAFGEEHHMEPYWIDGAPSGYHKFPSESASVPDPAKAGRWRYNPGASYLCIQRDSGTEWEDLTTPYSLFPTGTKMLFSQDSAPVGWTRISTYDDRMLRVVSSTGAGTGGTWGFDLDAKTSSHTHTIASYSGSLAHSFNSANADISYPDFYAIASVTDHSVSHTHGTVDSNDFSHTHSVAATWKPSYKDIIACQRD